ncbi:MAG: nitrophenyl compound nitroreductase subunit ArsF family protein [Candidatus Vecturithrix sp.]|nr:nitrophenyl compound nitroreductase subunit ArsF family protein [Candidatus Vecturithrix sp.]
MTYLQQKKRNVSLYLFVMMIGIFGSILVQPISAADHPIVYLFWSANCPACEEEKEFLHELQQNYPQVEMRWFDVGARPEFVDLAMLLCERQKISEPSIPLTFLGNWNHVGFQQRETSGAQIEEQVKLCLQHGCQDALLAIGPRQTALNIRNEANLHIPAGWEHYPAAAPQQPGSQAAQRTDKIIVYYLHGKARCASCETIEAYTRETVRDAFAEELKTGQLELQVLNVETPENKHFVKEYQLYSQSVVLSDVHEDQEVRWKNLPKIWKLLYDETAFKQYLQSEIADYLREERS